MLSFIRTHLIFLVSLYCVHTQMFRSSYFKISSQENLDKVEDLTLATNVRDEFDCASKCTSIAKCHYALFDKHLRKCSLVKATEKLSRRETEKPESGKILLEKVAIASNSNQDCDSVEMEENCDAHAKGKATKTSCGNILQHHSTSPTGLYNISVADGTWETWCEMNGVKGCDDGVWELVMRIKGAKDRFNYHSLYWTNKESFHIDRAPNKEKQIKLPGYWLRNFTKICVTMQFPANVSRNATSILLNHTAQSLHSVLHDGVEKALPADLSTIKTPPNIDKNCLIQGFNMLGPYPWQIKSRLVVQSEHVNSCSLPRLVRGVGIGFLELPEMSCGELRFGNSSLPVEAYPASCRVYIQ